MEGIFEDVASHFHCVFMVEPEQELIAKKVREDTNELRILRYLNTIQPTSEHVISLLDSFNAQSSWVIVPKMTTVANCITKHPHGLYRKADQVCWGLIKALAYLHEHCIALMDIKPDNLLVDQNRCIKIIDFDVAIQVKDEEVSGRRGTKHWMAPEVEEKKSMYSPHSFIFIALPLPHSRLRFQEPVITAPLLLCYCTNFY